ncbi:MAG: adenosine deaminase [Treponema sp.]|uniref:adenosine deaminase n=1 Tax=Treponema sp. TaxID=166 RepID=UPI0025EF83BE|nr:adenosine deaminase [Treponema sp.]MBQ9282735.1 adenosine deaminase [Treponema sp.]
MDKSEFYKFFKTIPKAELHIHIEAVMSRDTIKKLYLKKNGSEFSDEEMKKLFSYSDLNGFIAAFLQVQDLFTEVSDFDFVFEDLKNYLLRNGIVHCEAFFAPSAFIKKGFDYTEMTKNFEKNLKKIKDETGITVWLLGDVSRTFGLENAENNYKMFKANPFEGFIGIGLGGAESKGPSKDFGPVFEKAFKDSYHAVAHAGEDVGPESIWDALKICHAQRIGHGITSVQDSDLVKYLADSKIPVEVAPTSNVFTKKYVSKMSEHPVREMFDKGIAVTIATDDPLFFGVELLDEYWNLHSELRFTEEEIKQIILNSFDDSFLPEEEKSAFKKSVEEAMKD